MFISKHKKSIWIFCWILFWIYIGALVYFLFFSEMLGRAGQPRGYHYNLMPFREISRFLIYREQLADLAPGQFSGRIPALDRRIYRHQ